MQQDYNNTINLPKTEFPMRAGLPKREPGFLENWEKNDLYHELMKKNEGKTKYYSKRQLSELYELWHRIINTVREAAGMELTENRNPYRVNE